MSFRAWARDTRHRIARQGKYGALKSLYWLYAGAWLSVTSRWPVGTNVYDEQWDLLLILDGCRTDLLREVAEDYDFIRTVETRTSVGSTSSEWMANTFRRDRLDAVRETAYVSANPFTEAVFGDDLDSLPKAMASPFGEHWNVVDREDFQRLDPVWRDAWDDDLGTVPPRVVTNRVVETAREQDPERLIAHYMQPHQPFIAEGHELAGTVPRGAFADDDSGGNVWSTVRQGACSFETAWTAYRENLRLVLEEVALVLENVDVGTVVITADHGNAVGEWGVYGHPVGFPHPAVKRVPWVEMTAEDTGSYEVDEWREAGDDASRVDTDDDQRSESSAEQRLRDLGYLEP